MIGKVVFNKPSGKGSRLIVLLAGSRVDGYMELILCFRVRRRLAITTMK